MEHQQALEAIGDMLARSRKAGEKFRAGTAQHTLVRNRIRALEIAGGLLRGETFDRAELEQALPPLRSLISKSEKAREKLRPELWQSQMLERNLRALYLALPLAERGLE